MTNYTCVIIPSVMYCLIIAIFYNFSNNVCTKMPATTLAWVWCLCNVIGTKLSSGCQFMTVSNKVNVLVNGSLDVT